MRQGRHLVLRIGVLLTLIVLVSPIIAGLGGTLLPAFGYWPALGGLAGWAASPALASD